MMKNRYFKPALFVLAAMALCYCIYSCTGSGENQTTTTDSTTVVVDTVESK